MYRVFFQLGPKSTASTKSGHRAGWVGSGIIPKDYTEAEAHKVVAERTKYFPDCTFIAVNMDELNELG